MPKLKHFDNTGTNRFITFSCYRRLHFLENDQFKNIFLENLESVTQKYKIRILGYVVMPNHFHLVLLPESDVSMGKVVGELKSLSAREIFLTSHGHDSIFYNKLTKDITNNIRVFWQRRCYDHNCRTPDTVMEKINYCHNNPVKLGLVTKPSDWKWSSCRWYLGLDDIVLKIDGFDI